MWPSNNALLLYQYCSSFFSVWVKQEGFFLSEQRTDLEVGLNLRNCTCVGREALSCMWLFPCSSPIGCRHLIPSNEPQHQVCFLPPSTSESIYSRDLLQPEQSIHVWMKRSFTVMCYVPKTDDHDLCSALHCMWRRKIYHLYFQWVAQHK